MTATPATPPSPAYPPAGAAPYAPAPQQGPKLSASFTGVLMALGAVVAAVGTFLPWEKFVFFTADGTVGSSSQFTGLGAETREGDKIINFTFGNAGKIVIVAAVVVLVLGLLVLAKKGRLWTAIVSLIVSAAALLFSLVFLGIPASDQKDQRASDALAAIGVDNVNVLLKGGVIISAVGAGLMFLGSLLALIVRRRSV